MISRDLEKRLKALSGYFPVVFLTGPRQSGKTTLVQNTFPDLPYLSLENPDTKIIAQKDPRGFLENVSEGCILDEVQRTPHLFNYLQEWVDKRPNAQFILSGSQNFLVHEKITQSLAGRAGLLTLLPLSLSEMIAGKVSGDSKKWEKILYKGFYPGLYKRQIPANIFYNSYVGTYVERDLRLIKNITNLSDLNRFLKLCAGRAGQLLNISSLAADTGIAPNTAREWLSLLEASCIIYFLKPYYKNFNKRLVKMPKLYFYDTGLLCYLLDIQSPEQVSSHYAIGSLFENLIIVDILKHFANKAEKSRLFFWRDNKGKEIDLVIETGEEEIIIEIKAGKTRQLDSLKNLEYYQKISDSDAQNAKVIYGGSGEIVNFKGASFIPWNKFPEWLSSNGRF